MLIPGNPNVASYYESWIKEIEDQNKNINITYASSYVLFDKKLNYLEYDLAMRDHYEKIFIELSREEKVTIIAHSVGSYFALRLLEKYPEKIEKVIIMFPYIGYSTIKSLRIIGILYLMDRILPIAEMLSKYKNFFLIWDKDTKNISTLGLNACLRFGVRQCVYFNKYKFDTKSIFLYKDKLDFIYADDDRWCPAETIELLKPISNHKKVGLPHGFILTKEDRTEMTKILGINL